MGGKGHGTGWEALLWERREREAGLHRQVVSETEARRGSGGFSSL